MKIKDPNIIKNIFSIEEHKILKDTMFNAPRPIELYDVGFGRYHIGHPILQEYTNKVLPIAREYFNSDTLVPSYTLFSHYEGKNAQLWKHKDDNACTYTIDMCVYQTGQWDLWVDNKPYTLNENEAVAYYGTEQEHWREEFPYKEGGHVAMIFFHFVEPDHWYITKGPSYIQVIRGIKTEEEWNNND